MIVFRCFRKRSSSVHIPLFGFWFFVSSGGCEGTCRGCLLAYHRPGYIELEMRCMGDWSHLRYRAAWSEPSVHVDLCLSRSPETCAPLSLSLRMWGNLCFHFYLSDRNPVRTRHTALLVLAILLVPRAAGYSLIINQAVVSMPRQRPRGPHGRQANRLIKSYSSDAALMKN